MEQRLKSNPLCGYVLSAYACIPLYLAGAVLLFPEPLLNMIVLLGAGAYSGYVFYRGLPIVMGITEERAFFVRLLDSNGCAHLFGGNAGWYGCVVEFRLFARVCFRVIMGLLVMQLNK